MTEVRQHVTMISRRRFADFLLFGVTSVELGILFFLTHSFTLIDWIYVLQHPIVLGIALTRRPPEVQDRSMKSTAAVCADTLSGCRMGQLFIPHELPPHSRCLVNSERFIPTLLYSPVLPCKRQNPY
jgi:hypothetical protein